MIKSQNSVLKYFTKLRAKNLWQFFFSKVAKLKISYINKKAPYHRYFPGYFMKFLKTHIIYINVQTKRVLVYILHCGFKTFFSNDIHSTIRYEWIKEMSKVIVIYQSLIIFNHLVSKLCLFSFYFSIQFQFGHINKLYILSSYKTIFITRPCLFW